MRCSLPRPPVFRGSAILVLALAACQSSGQSPKNSGGGSDDEDAAVSETGGRGGTGSGTGGSPTGGRGGGSAGTGGGAAGGSGGSAPAPDGGAGAGGGAGGAGGGGGGAGGAGGAGGQPRDAGVNVDPNCTPSKLYGKTGELWKPDGRLIEAGWAGYHTGTDPIPVIEGPVKRVTDFGAKGDDMTDDTQAFLDGIAATDGVLLVPAGRYVITKQLFITKSNFVLRGEDQAKSILYFPRSLSEVGVGGTNWSFNGGFVTVSGTDPGEVLATVTTNAPRGANQLQVSATAGIKVGDWIRIIQTDKGGSLLSALYAGTDPGNVGEDGNTEIFRFYSRVTAVAATSITLERLLPFQVDTRWTPQIRAAKPTTREVGVEKLTLEMASGTYPGHFNEKGYNGIYYVGAHDSWVRDVTVLNAELGISIYRSYFVTVTDVVLDANIDRGAYNGHHGLNSARGTDVFFTRFDVRKRYVHDLTVDGYAFGTVWSKGKGIDLNMDHHGRAPYGTLWTDMDLGRGTRAFANGGAGNRLPATGAYTTVWNVRAAGSIGLPPASEGPLMNFVASAKGSPPSGWSVEDIAPASLCQPDLHEAMLARRP